MGQAEKAKDQKKIKGPIIGRRQIVAFDVGRPVFLHTTDDRMKRLKVKPMRMIQGAHCAGLTGRRSIELETVTKSCI